MKNDRRDNERPEAYPKPSTTDQQLKNQTEFLDDAAIRSGDDNTPVTYNTPQTDERMRESGNNEKGQGPEYEI